jgi:curli biogenesis system outer membrane secretion channel CsgG
MKGCLKAILATALTTFALAGPPWQTSKIKLAIKTFDNPTTSANSTIGNAVTDIFFTELGRTGLFQLVERSAFAEIEKEASASGDVMKAKIAADYVLLGKVTNFSFDERAYQEQVQTSRGLVMRTSYRQSASVRVDFRIVSTADASAVVTESGAGAESRVSATSEKETFDQLLKVGVFSAEAQDSLIGRATISAIRNAVRKITDLSKELANRTSAGAMAGTVESLAGLTGHVIAEVGEAFFVDLGSGHGLQKGDRLKVFTKEVTKDNQGRVVYEQEVEVGALEIVDVSMKDRAKAQLTGPQGSARGPKEGDLIRIDIERAKAVRGRASTPPTPGGGPGSSDNKAAEVQRLERQADRYVEDKYFAQAVDYYQKALALQPDSPQIMDKLASALLYNKQMTEAEDVINRLFGVNGSISVGVVHNHAFGMCFGELTIASGSISYKPQRGDHAFSATISQVMGFVEGSIDRVIPSLTLRFRDSQNDEKKFDFLVPAYLKHNGQSGPPSRVFFGNAEAQADTARVHRMLIRLIEDKLRKR